jgi:hypothetical protein
VSKHHVIPRLKPGGRKTLKDGLETQGLILLFHNLIVLPDKGYSQFTNNNFFQGAASIMPEEKHRHWPRLPNGYFCIVSFIKRPYKGIQTAAEAKK